ncbi:FG-GAP repeat domain-containing protein, partial [Allorhizocola rhizosphaerae]|uniref:FG-GAP repeat domain-containing protein n=1 Tax=Allorhizocola rhizosphaerae TaxID=1872709 RepID=UPI001B8D9AD9
VAGAAALILAANPGLTPAQVATVMFGNATPNIVTNPGTGSPNRLLFTNAAAPPSGPFQQFIFQSGTAIEQTGANWEFAFTDWDRDGRPDLAGIKKSSTGSGRTEVHILSGASGFQQFVFQAGTAIEQTGAEWDFEFADWDRDGRPDLAGVKKSGTGSGRTEVHILSGASGFQQFVFQAGTAIGQTGATWEFQFADWDRDGRPDLAGVSKSSTGSGRTEVHILSGASGFQQFVLQTGTAIEQTGANWEFAFTDWDRDGRPDLAGVKKNSTGSGRTEVHILSGASAFQQFALQTATALSPIADLSQWEFGFPDWDRDGRPDLAGVNKSSTGSGRTEVHILKG